MISKISIEQTVKEATIDLPASKSLSNRALIMQALCPEPCRLTHLSDCDDTKVMLAAFDKLATTLATEAEPLLVDIGAAGTSMRFLTAYFASREGAEVIMTGTERMKQRPIKILVDALRELGAEIEYLETEGCPPLRIHGHRLNGGPLSIDGSTSSQYISALLMVAPTLAQGLQLTLTGDVTSRPYILMTLGMMREFGIESTWEGNVISIAPQTYKAQRYEVESDWSAASYWYEIMALQGFRFSDSPTEHLLLKGLHKQSLQGDAKVAEYFLPLGVTTTFCNEGAVLKLVDTNVKKKLGKVELDLSEQPDLAQTIIVTLADLEIPFSIKGLHTLRIKETDRIAALEKELKKVDATVLSEDNDRMYCDGERKCNPYDFEPIKTYEDHRMAMAFAPLALSWGDMYIENPQVVTKSYPQYWEHLKQIGFNVIENYTLEQIQQDKKASEESAEQWAKETFRPYKRKLYLRTVLLYCLIILVFLVLLYLLKK